MSGPWLSNEVCGIFFFSSSFAYLLLSCCLFVFFCFCLLPLFFGACAAYQARRVGGYVLTYLAHSLTHPFVASIETGHERRAGSEPDCEEEEDDGEG